MKRIFLIIYIIFCWALQGQTTENKTDSIFSDEYILLEGDSIYRTSIDLDDVYIFGELHFNSRNDKLRYFILRRKTIKVYPYAKLAAERLTTLTDRLDQIKSKSKRRKYTKIIQRYIEEEFSAELKKLSRTEGQILVKLIHRQTGKTAFSLIKELRSGWRAFWYNATAKAFKISLKKKYLPEEVQEDYLIEDILQRAFASGRLEKQSSVLAFDYSSLTDKWSEKKSLKN
jgi:hypothetical protein